MSRISKWKLEKTKVKVVFRLQFHATHIPHTGWDKLFISFIPADTGKATAKTTKANVRNGTCKWADPIYETTRLLQDSKSKQYDEKLYKIVVAMGSSRASTLGEATINLADYVDALKPSAVSLPLHGCNFGTILHITIQLLTSKTGFREFEQQRELRETGLQSGVDSHGRTAPGKMPYSEEVTNDHTDKVNARIKFKAEANELSSLEEEANMNEEYADSATGFDGSSNTSGSLYAEKHETTSANEIDSLKSTTSGNLHVLSHSQSPHAAKRDPPDHPNTAQGSTGSAHGWGSDNSVDSEFAMACEENNRLRGSLELAESSFFNLKLEVGSLQSFADELGAETQKFSHLLAAEISSSEVLAKEVSVMKTDCVKFKDDLIRLKDLKLNPQIPITGMSGNQVEHLVQNMQLQFLKGINVVEGKIRDLLNKKYVVPHDGDTKFIYLELEALLRFLMDFKLGNGEVTTLLSALPSERADMKEIREPSAFTDQQFVSGNGLGLDLCPPESILCNFGMTPPVSEVVNPLGAIDAMKGQIFDLVRELDEAKVEKEALARKMDQMECYYEALIQELEENQKRMLEELQLLRNEHSTCLYTLSASKAEMESLRQDMNQQMIRFVDERRDLEALNKELERRATTSEAALRRARLNYSIAVDKLQKDLELLSSQVMSMFETNENLIKQALPSQPHSQGNQKLLENQEDDDIKKLSQNQNLGTRKRSVGGDVLLEDLKKSFAMQEELYQKLEQELIEMYSINLNLDIYSKALQQSLREADADIRLMKGKMDELVEELELSAASQNQLMVRLQKATDDIHVLNEYKSRCSDMALQNQLLEDKVASVSEENYRLAQKLKDSESVMMEYRGYQSKYAACLAENAELSLKLKHEAFENVRLSDEMSVMKEKLMVLKSESDELVSSKDSLEENIHFVQYKWHNMLTSYDKQFGCLANRQNLDLKSADVKDAVLQLEEIQHNACERNHQLMEENENLKSERAIADVSLSNARSEILAMKQKFKSSIQLRDMVTKLDVSNALVEKLQAELESVANKLRRGSEIEDEYKQQSEVLLADLARLEDQIQELMCKKGHLAQEIMGLDALAEELGNSELTIAQLMHDKQELAVCLQDKTEESIELSREITSLKDDLKILHDELHEEKASKDELEAKVQDLTSQLNGERDKLLDLEGQKDELMHVKELVSDLELEKSRLVQELSSLDALADELGRSKLTVTELMQDKQELTVRLQDKSEESIKLSREISSLGDDLKSLHDELREEKAYKDDLEGKVRDLTSQLHKDRDKLLDFEEQKAELMRVRELVSALELEKSRLVREISGLDALAEELGSSKLIITELMHDKQELALCLQDKTEESINLSHEISSLKDNLKILRDELHEEITYKDELEGKLRDLTSQLHEDRDKLLDFEEQKAELMHVRELVSDLEIEKSRLARLLDQQNAFTKELKKNSSYQDSLESQLLELHEYSLAADVKLVYVANQYEDLLEELQQKLVSSDGCLGRLQKRYRDTEVKWKEEKANLLTSLESLRSDLEVSRAQNKLLSDLNDGVRDELEQCKEKLKVMETCISSDNMLQDSEVEQLKKLIIDAEDEISYLTVSKEELEILVIVLKDKVDEQSASMTLPEEHENEMTRLRMQCNELSHKLSEQVLKTEEFKNLSTHLKELKDKAEAECLIAREKRETEVPSFTVQDSLRIAFIKEQYETKIQELKQQLSISKKHGEEMLLKLQDAINEVENRKKSEAMNLKRNEELLLRLSDLEEELRSALAEKREKSKAYDRTKAELECALLSLECCKEEKEKLGSSLLEFEAEKSELANELTSVKGQLKNLKSSKSFEKDECGSMTEVEHAINGSTGNSSPIFLEQNESPYGVKRERANFMSIADGETADSTKLVQDATVEEFPQSNGENLEVNIESLGAQRLRSSIEHLHEELEKMKTENTIFDIDHDEDPGFEVPEREIMQLHKANEELRSMFPSFNEISSGGNALERVLALEIELAEALKAKNKSNLQFQSSFLKQHSDEEAIFKSFRDINELIKETLELKGKHTAMEAELRDMHDRYSRLSLQFAEVEGERQKLRMTLKNVRASKKPVSLNQSSSANVMDHPY